jgi:hypothetical protein
MKKKLEPRDAYEYTDWLYCSGRLTAEEHLALKQFLLQLEENVAFGNIGC